MPSSELQSPATTSTPPGPSDPLPVGFGFHGGYVSTYLANSSLLLFFLQWGEMWTGRGEGSLWGTHQTATGMSVRCWCRVRPGQVPRAVHRTIESANCSRPSRRTAGSSPVLLLADGSRGGHGPSKPVESEGFVLGGPGLPGVAPNQVPPVALLLGPNTPAGHFRRRASSVRP